MMGSSLELGHLRDFSPLLALFSLQFNHILDIVFPESSVTIVDVRARLSKPRRVLHTSVDFVSSQLQDPNTLVGLKK